MDRQKLFETAKEALGIAINKLPEQDGIVDITAMIIWTTGNDDDILKEGPTHIHSFEVSSELIETVDGDWFIEETRISKQDEEA